MHPEDNRIQAKSPPAGRQSCIFMEGERNGKTLPGFGCVGNCNCDSIRSAVWDFDPDPVGRYDGLWAIGPHLILRTTEAHYRHDCWEISSLNPSDFVFSIFTFQA